MKIAIATDADGRVARHGGRCAAFTIYEIDGNTRRLEFRPNAHAGEPHHHGAHPGGESCGHGGGHASVLDALADCQVLLAGGLGPRLVADLASRGIKAIVCDEQDPQTAATALAAGTLAIVEGNPHCHHG